MSEANGTAQKQSSADNGWAQAEASPSDIPISTTETATPETSTKWTLINGVPAEAWVKYEQELHWHEVEKQGIALMERGAEMRRNGETRLLDAQNMEESVREEEEEALRHGKPPGSALAEKIGQARKEIDSLLRRGYDLTMDGDKVAARGQELRDWATIERRLLWADNDGREGS
jgi:hypothetical protein